MNNEDEVFITIMNALNSDHEFKSADVRKITKYVINLLKHQTVFVILGENGEYSGRDVWVSGVYLTREEAEQAVLEHLAKRRELDTWNERYQNSLPKGYMFTKNGYTYTPPTDEERALAREIAGQEPIYERAEMAEIFEVTIGQWKQGAE